MWLQAWWLRAIKRLCLTTLPALLSGAGINLYAPIELTLQVQDVDAPKPSEAVVYVTRATQTIPYFYNRAPTAVADSFSTPIETTLTMNLVANDTDPDGQALTPEIVTQPTYGTVAVSSPTAVVYTPSGKPGADKDSFTYRVKDTSGRVLVCGFSQHQLQQLQLSANHQRHAGDLRA